MKNIAALIGFSAIIAASTPLQSIAKPNVADIQSLYAEYKTALGETSFTHAYSAAEKVWKASESVYGDSRQTGDFAYNYAVLAKSLSNGKVDRRIEKAFKRSIALAPLHGDKSSKISMSRHLHYGAYLSQVGKDKQAAPILQSAADLARKANLTKGKDYLQIVHKQADAAYNLKQYRNAKTHIDTALSIIKTTQLPESKQTYQIQYTKAKIEEKLGNWQAALAGYEKIFINIDRVLDMKEGIIGRAFIKEGMLRRKIRNSGEFSDADINAASQCFGCWPNIESGQRTLAEQSAHYTIKRTPPGMPKHAMSSGFVVVKYDTDDAGIPTNLRIIGASHSKTFDAASTLAIRRWHVYEEGTKTPAKNVKDLVTTMTFYLSSRRGKVLDFYGRSIPD